MNLPMATARCTACGVAVGATCVCTPEYAAREAWEEEHRCPRCDGSGVEPADSEPGICAECRGVGFDEEIPVADSIQNPS